MTCELCYRGSPAMDGGPDGPVTDCNCERPASVCFDYRNHRGVVRFRRVLPIRLWYGNSIYHSGEQYFLRAYDLDKGGVKRDFAMKDVQNWGTL